MKYRAPIKVNGQDKAFETDDFDRFVNFLITVRVSNEIFKDAGVPILYYNVAFPAVILEAAKIVMPGEDLADVEKYVKSLEDGYYDVIHEGIRGIMEKFRQDERWAAGIASIRAEMAASLKGGIKSTEEAENEK